MKIDTLPEDDPVRVYLTTIAAAFPPLSPTEEVECSEQVRRQDELADFAGVRLAGGHAGLVVSIAQRYQNDRFHILDPVQAGNTGILSALEALKTGAPRRFSDLAAEHAEQAIRRVAESR
jgi:DNA-directed RNA polymerase sigma subunit (sigma70/sigma32)